MNKFQVIGRICKDIELKYNDKGTSIVMLTVAVNRPKKKDEEQQADFINIKLFNRLADVVAEYCEKGSQICIEGVIRNNNYIDKEGNKRYEYTFIGQNAEFLSKPTNYTKNEKTEQYEAKNSATDEDVYAQFGESIEISDDEIAF